MDLSSAAAFEASFPFGDALEAQIRALLGAATRAPSTHNSQPWRFRIAGGTLQVFRDTEVRLPHSDPVARYAHVSIGFLLHHITLLAEWLSMAPEVELVLRDDHIATIRLSLAGKPAATPKRVEAVFVRRNRRGEFEPVPIPPEVLADALRIEHPLLPLPEAKAAVREESIEAVAEATEKNMRRVYARAPFRREMSSWITPTGSWRRDGLPGYSLNQPALMTWIVPLVIRFVNVGAMLGKLNRVALRSAPAVFGFGAPDTPRGWLSCGYAASHAALTLIAHGLDYSVFVASIEYPDTRKEVGAALGLSEPLEFLFAAGKLPGHVDWKTPRVPLHYKMKA